MYTWRLTSMAGMFIPAEAMSKPALLCDRQYCLLPSAVDSIIELYQVKTIKPSGIVNGPTTGPVSATCSENGTFRIIRNQQGQHELHSTAA